MPKLIASNLSDEAFLAVVARPTSPAPADGLLALRASLFDGADETKEDGERPGAPSPLRLGAASLAAHAAPPAPTPDDAFDDAFDAFEAYAGARDGWLFREGDRGLGYYKDYKAAAATSTATAAGSSRALAAGASPGGTATVALPDLKNMDAKTLGKHFKLHDLLRFAAEAMEAISRMDDDDLDVDSDEDDELIDEMAGASDEEDVDAEGKHHLHAVGDPENPGMSRHLEEEVKDLAHLDVAFAHLTDRFKHRLSVRVLDEINMEGGAEELDDQDPDAEDAVTRKHLARILQEAHDEIDPDGLVGESTLRKRPLTLSIAHIWRHHVEHGLLVLYHVPKVRYHHDDPQHDHEVDWADLFFDLTYVAGAYRLGTMLKYSVSMEGFWHFMVLTIVMLDAWKFKTLHDATFETTDVAHKMVDVLYSLTAAGCAIFVRPLKEMQDMTQGAALGFSICAFANVAVLALQKLEIIYNHMDGGVMHRSAAAHRHCRQGFLIEVLPRLGCFLVAIMLSATSYSSGQAAAADDDGAAAAASYSAYSPYSAASYASRRHLAATSSSSYGSGAPSEFEGPPYWVISLALFGSHVFGTLLPMLAYLLKWLPGLALPWHYQHVAHRYGEVTMLLIGESVLSMILATPANSVRYFGAFAAALVTVQLLQVIHYSSEEFDPEHHALHRKLRAGRVWIQMNTLYGVGLIAFGVAIKALLGNVVCPGGEYGYHRHLLSADEAEGAAAAEAAEAAAATRQALQEESSSGGLGGGRGLATYSAYAAYASAYSSAYSSYSAYSSSYDGADASYGNEYCGPAEKPYVYLLCYSSILQFLAQNINLPLHEGIDVYMAHFFKYSEHAAYYVFGMKGVSVLATIAVSLEQNLLAHEVLVMMLFIKILQSVAQVAENMIVQTRRDHLEMFGHTKDGHGHGHGHGGHGGGHDDAEAQKKVVEERKKRRRATAKAIKKGKKSKQPTR